MEIGGLNPLRTHSYAPPPPVPSAQHRHCDSVLDSLLQQPGRTLRYTYGQKITHCGSGGLYKLLASVHV